MRKPYISKLYCYIIFFNDTKSNMQTLLNLENIVLRHKSTYVTDIKLKK